MTRFLSMIAVMVAVPLFTGCLPYSTGPTEVGVRTKTFTVFGTKGVQDKVFPPGSTYFMVPFFNDWHTFDTRLQKLEMTADTSVEGYTQRDDLLFKTVDGNDISLDITIQYRIDRDRAPYILQNVARNDDELRNNIIRSIARSRPRDIFGELNTEEFYIAENRSQKADAVKEELNEILSQYGIIVERVNTFDYRFPPEYQQAIEDKKVADQQASKHRSSAMAKHEENLKLVEQANGEVNKIRAAADGEFERAKIEADAYFEQQQQIAQAIEAEGRAESQGIRTMNEALAGSGGEAMVKLRFAEALKGMRILFVPSGDAGGLDVRSTDINSLIDLRGIQRIARPEEQTDQAPGRTTP